ncbi:ureidoglycolate lyase [Methylobacterium terricola]|nr:ureidoglycolate lyase [Methylobacterium terricola]
MRTLPIEPITPEAFAPYGTLLIGPAAGPPPARGRTGRPRSRTGDRARP